MLSSRREKYLHVYSLVAVRPRTTIFRLKSIAYIAWQRSTNVERRTTLPIFQIGVRERWLSVSEKSQFMDEKEG